MEIYSASILLSRDTKLANLRVYESFDKYKKIPESSQLLLHRLLTHIVQKYTIRYILHHSSCQCKSPYSQILSSQVPPLRNRNIRQSSIHEA